MYSATELDAKLREHNKGRPIRLVVSGSSGSGRSTVLASVPVPEGKQRIALDFSDSLAYLDAGLEGEDVYQPRRQQFHMERVIFPAFEDILHLFAKLVQPECGALIVDDIKLMQGVIKRAFVQCSSSPKVLKRMLAEVGADEDLPGEEAIQGWGMDTTKSLTEAMHGLVRSLMRLVIERGIHFVGSTGEFNVWENWNSPTARIVDRQSDLWSIWSAYTDLVVGLERTPNYAAAPIARLYRYAPKTRIQGLNPSWVMEWASFIKELEAAGKRTTETIPAKDRIPNRIIAPEPEHNGSVHWTANESKRLLEILYIFGRSKGFRQDQVRSILKEHQLKGSFDLVEEDLEDYKRMIEEKAEGRK
jgi:hypothetical protein